VWCILIHHYYSAYCETRNPSRELSLFISFRQNSCRVLSFHCHETSSSLFALFNNTSSNAGTRVYDMEQAHHCECSLWFILWSVTMAHSNIIEKWDWKEWGRKRSPPNHDNIRLFDLSNCVKPWKTLFIIAGAQADIRSEYFPNREG